MTTMNVSLPDGLKAFVEEQVSSRGYGTASEYVRELIRNDAKAKAQVKLDTLLLEGLEGEASEWTDTDSERLVQLAANGP